jgi:hypothetical protein
MEKQFPLLEVQIQPAARFLRVRNNNLVVMHRSQFFPCTLFFFFNPQKRLWCSSTAKLNFS